MNAVPEDGKSPLHPSILAAMDEEMMRLVTENALSPQDLKDRLDEVKRRATRELPDSDRTALITSYVANQFATSTRSLIMDEFDEAAEAEARRLLTELQALLALPTNNNAQGDRQYELITDIQEWSVEHSQPNDRHAAYIVVLEQDVRDEDAMRLTQLLCLIEGVVSVVPVEADHRLIISEHRWRNEIANKLYGLSREVRG